MNNNPPFGQYGQQQGSTGFGLGALMKGTGREAAILTRFCAIREHRCNASIGEWYASSIAARREVRHDHESFSTEAHAMHCTTQAWIDWAANRNTATTIGEVSRPTAAADSAA